MTDARDPVQTEGNVAFYQKQRFQVASDGLVPGQSLRLWAMLRETAQ
jgi:hypothetical protein